MGLEITMRETKEDKRKPPKRPSRVKMQKTKVFKEPEYMKHPGVKHLMKMTERARLGATSDKEAYSGRESKASTTPKGVSKSYGKGTKTVIKPEKKPDVKTSKSTSTPTSKSSGKTYKVSPSKKMGNTSYNITPTSNPKKESTSSKTFLKSQDTSRVYGKKDYRDSRRTKTDNFWMPGNRDDRG